MVKIMWHKGLPTEDGIYYLKHDYSSHNRPVLCVKGSKRNVSNNHGGGPVHIMGTEFLPGLMHHKIKKPSGKWINLKYTNEGNDYWVRTLFRGIECLGLVRFTNYNHGGFVEWLSHPTTGGQYSPGDLFRTDPTAEFCLIGKYDN
jgi:hypothetical protein